MDIKDLGLDLQQVETYYKNDVHGQCPNYFGNAGLKDQKKGLNNLKEQVSTDSP